MAKKEENTKSENVNGIEHQNKNTTLLRNRKTYGDSTSITFDMIINRTKTFIRIKIDSYIKTNSFGFTGAYTLTNTTQNNTAIS